MSEDKQGSRKIDPQLGWYHSLWVRLLFGLSLAVVLPLGLFGFFGERRLRETSTENIVQAVLTRHAAGTAERIEAMLDRAMDSANVIYSSLFKDGEPKLEDFRDWELRGQKVFSALGDVILLKNDGEILYHQAGHASNLRGQKVKGQLAVWAEAAFASTDACFLPPAPDPDGLSSSRDPSRYVLPLLIPFRNDRQTLRGACICLLPFAKVQAEIYQTNKRLEDSGIVSNEVYLVDTSSKRYLLHTELERIGSVATPLAKPGFHEEEDGRVKAVVAVSGQASLQWTVGVRASGRDFVFSSVEQLQSFFWWLVLFVVVGTLGIAALLLLAATRSLRRLEDVTEELGLGRLDARAPVGGPREVRKLASALNTMAGQLESERERLKHAERDRAWTAMARQVAHEIKNPLQPVRLHGELILRTMANMDVGGLLKKELESRERMRTSVEVILRQVDSLQRIVKDFSDFAEAGEESGAEAGEESGAEAGEEIGKQEQFSFDKVWEDVQRLYDVPADERVQISFAKEPDALQLSGSALRLQQVLVNLVNNALEASIENPPGDGSTEVIVDARVQDRFCRIEVRDRGVGLPVGMSGRIFEPYSSTKKGGTGLGLAICRRNVEAMGGRLEVVAREGGGVVASVELPLADGSQLPKEPS